MKITSGTLRGRQIIAPKGKNTRPTPSMVRQAIFNRLGDTIVGAKVLDLFAGSGVISFEAVSRGAADATLIENESAAKMAILRTVESLQIKNVKLLPGDVFKIIPRLADREFDFIYADPPYNLGFGEKIVAAICEYKLLKPDGNFFLEEGSELTLSSSLSLEDVRRYGSTFLHRFNL